jgi:hypothetical protein
MSSFKEFMNEAEAQYNKALTTSDKSLEEIQTALSSSIGSIVTSLSLPADAKQEFSEEVSNLVRDKEFISQFSESIGMPLEDETEDDFVERSNGILREILHSRFGIKD